MPVQLYGELDPASGYIMLSAGGASDWDARDITDRLKFCTPEFSVSDSWLKVPCSWSGVTQIVHSFPDTQRFQWAPGPELSAWLVAEIVRRSCQGDFTGEPPVRDPMPHQRAGAIAIGMNGRYLLADEPGAGKTACALMGLAELEARNRNPFPALIVCPAAVIDPWLEELEIVYPQWRPFARAYRGPSRRKLLITKGVKILVTSYETMRNDVGDAAAPGPLMSFPFGTVVYDECHKLCNYDTKQSVRARRLAKNIANVIAMSGTPITRNAESFYPVLNALYPGAYPSRDRYKARYTMDKGSQYSYETGGLDPLREPEFRLSLQGTMRRVAKADVLKDLPPKTYQTRWLDIPPKWRTAYDEMEADMIAHMPDDADATPLTAMSNLSRMMRLRQLACSACDVEVVATDEWDEDLGEFATETIVTPREPCWKADEMLDIMDELHQGYRPGQNTGIRPVIAFAPYKKLMMLAGAMAERRGYKVGYIVGGMSDRQRTQARLAFQDRQLDLICVTTGAGGSGLTLTAADTVVFLARPWPLVEAVQAEDRTHRPGQTRSVQIIDLETRNSVESRVRAALHDKMHHLSELVQDPRMVEEFLGGKRKEAA